MWRQKEEQEEQVKQVELAGVWSESGIQTVEV